MERLNTLHLRAGSEDLESTDAIQQLQFDEEDELVKTTEERQELPDKLSETQDDHVKNRKSVLKLVTTDSITDKLIGEFYEDETRVANIRKVIYASKNVADWVAGEVAANEEDWTTTTRTRPRCGATLPTAGTCCGQRAGHVAVQKEISLVGPLDATAIPSSSWSRRRSRSGGAGGLLLLAIIHIRTGGGTRCTCRRVRAGVWRWLEGTRAVDHEKRYQLHPADDPAALQGCDGHSAGGLILGRRNAQVRDGAQGPSSR